MNRVKRFSNNISRKCKRNWLKIKNFFAVDRVDHGPIAVRDLKMIYYYSAMSLLILILLALLVCVIVMINKGVTLKDVLSFDGKTEQVLFWIRKIKKVL